jgi:hypothetical protein
MAFASMFGLAANADALAATSAVATQTVSMAVTFKASLGASDNRFVFGAGRMAIDMTYLSSGLKHHGRFSEVPLAVS